MDKIRKAVQVFKKGGIVIFPTDTAIGIGCRIDNEESIKRLFKIRKRPENKPVLTLVDSVKMAQNYLLPIPQEVKDKLIKHYWPGKLTIILKCNPDKVPFPARDKRNTLGVRFPGDKMLLKLIAGVGVPIVAPSANFSGEETPFRFADLNSKLVRQADYVLTGPVSSEKNVSTIIDCVETPWRIIRDGSVKINKKLKIALLLNTSDNQKITVGLIINGKDVRTKKTISRNMQTILPMIEKFLKKYSLKPEDLTEIKVNTGPGSFTGLRVGLAIVNALSFVLGVPVNDKKVGEIILPMYK